MRLRKFLWIVIATCSIQAPVLADAVRVVSHSEVPNPRQPQVAVDPTGAIYVTFGSEKAIYCVQSSDDGTTFGTPVRVGELPDLALGRRRGPRIVAGEQAVVVTAVGHRSGNVYSWTSTDHGQNWTKSVSVNDSPKDAREGLHAMAMAPNGDVYCTWLDLRSGTTEIFGSLSTDRGRTWSSNQLVYRSPSGSVCECCHPAATFDSAGNLAVMWRNSLNGARDMFVASSTDHGQTFGTAQKLGQGSWELDACPMDGGYLAFTGAGELSTVWQRDGNVYRTKTGQSTEQLLGKGSQPWIAGSDAGAFIIWQSQRNGNLMVVSPNAKQPRKIADSASDPVITTRRGGKGSVVAVWETGSKNSTSIMAKIIR